MMPLLQYHPEKLPFNERFSAQQFLAHDSVFQGIYTGLHAWCALPGIIRKV